MCSCGKRTSFSDIVSEDKSSLPYLKYLECKHKSQFKYVFAKVGLTITEDNLKSLARLYDTGGDRLGMAKDPSGKPVYFSVEEQLKLINPNDVESNTCSI